ncbi:hypothetical protein FKM82_011433 [Ascaphus truei]
MLCAVYMELPCCAVSVRDGCALQLYNCTVVLFAKLLEACVETGSLSVCVQYKGSLVSNLKSVCRRCYLVVLYLDE